MKASDIRPSQCLKVKLAKAFYSIDFKNYNSHVVRNSKYRSINSVRLGMTKAQIITSPSILLVLLLIESLSTTTKDEHEDENVPHIFVSFTCLHIH